MKRVIFSLIALCLLISGALAEPRQHVAAGGFGAGNNLTGFWQKPAVSGALPSVSFVAQTANNTDGGPFTFTDHATGTAGATRKTIVAACAEDGAINFSVSSVTVGGVAASEVADTANSSSVIQCAIYIINNPTGTTATIVVTFSEAVTSASVSVWAAYDLNSSTQTDLAVNFSTDSSPMSADLDVSADGIAVGVCAAGNNAGTTTWTGLTERDDDASGELSYSAADFTNDVSADAPLAVTCDYAGTNDAVIATASFR